MSRETTTIAGRWIRRFTEVGIDDISVVGGKNASLVAFYEAGLLRSLALLDYAEAGLLPDPCSAWGPSSATR